MLVCSEEAQLWESSRTHVVGVALAEGPRCRRGLTASARPDDASLLTPFSVRQRYELDHEPVDHRHLLSLSEQVAEWAAAELDG